MSEKIRVTAGSLLGISFLAAVFILIGMWEWDSGIACGAAVGTVVAGWLIYILLTGYAEIIDNTAEQARCGKELLKVLSSDKAEPSPKTTAYGQANRVENTAPVMPVRTATPLLKADDESDSVYGDRVIECPECGMVQKKNRNVCWKCGVRLAHTEAASNEM